MMAGASGGSSRNPLRSRDCMRKSRKPPDGLGTSGRGKARPGKVFVPPTEKSDEPDPDRTRAAPAPGVPMSEADYRRLKEAARQRPPETDDTSAQEDVPKRPRR
jgi:hypothetical protein